jgi:hypothetical protein
LWVLIEPIDHSCGSPWTLWTRLEYIYSGL